MKEKISFKVKKLKKEEKVVLKKRGSEESIRHFNFHLLENYNNIKLSIPTRTRGHITRVIKILFIIL